MCVSYWEAESNRSSDCGRLLHVGKDAKNSVYIECVCVSYWEAEIVSSVCPAKREIHPMEPTKLAKSTARHISYHILTQSITYKDQE